MDPINRYVLYYRSFPNGLHQNHVALVKAYTAADAVLQLNIYRQAFGDRDGKIRYDLWHLAPITTEDWEHLKKVKPHEAEDLDRAATPL